MHVLVLGAGPAGLGAAWRLAQQNSIEWSLIEAENEPGGLSRSITDKAGFIWDVAGLHILQTQSDVFYGLLNSFPCGLIVEHDRSSWVALEGGFVPYPLQYNTELYSEDLVKPFSDVNPKNFLEWSVQNFGEKLTEMFMVPYNRKVWGCELDQLGVGWVTHRVPPASDREESNRTKSGRSDSSWGPNTRFWYPRLGGIGFFWRGFCRRLPTDRVRFGSSVVEIAAVDKTVVLQDGSRISYDYLISTMPIDLLVGMVSDRHDLQTRSAGLSYSSLHVVGVGLSGKPPELLSGKNWIYYADPDVPYHRVLVSSSLSSHVVPYPSKQWSLLCEVGESEIKTVDGKIIADQVVEALRESEIIPQDVSVASLWHNRIEHAYPTPTVGRDSILGPLESELRRLDIWSRGRFGAWKYELGNMDHSFLQGVEAVESIIEELSEAN